ncbi:hypothetical protein EYF80_038668 [Liparis tanakae]|uniref:Uncharacterized protein n=1 Tax=Liparis tanakae TaxID=230148 RepID=A0A4Z2GC63_9TELE|nr:hypothetical protein EYF80_038668 [Liparis tanakae]
MRREEIAEEGIGLISSCKLGSGRQDEVNSVCEVIGGAAAKSTAQEAFKDTTHQSCRGTDSN